jgi:quercetin dioxygenase-like cupin family protein
MRGTRVGTAKLVMVGMALVGSAVFLTAALPSQREQTPTYERSSNGTRLLRARSGLAIKVLVEREVFGDQTIEVAEMTLPSAPNAGAHQHGSSEILYVLSGRLNHVVNDTVYKLEAGMVGIVRPGDRVAHRVNVGDTARVLVIWVPGGEVQRLSRSPGFETTYIR